jgi:hypothetical protein
MILVGTCTARHLQAEERSGFAVVGSYRSLAVHYRVDGYL